MKQMLEGALVTRSTQLHLDRCLTCRNCESTCPSGVQYGRLVEIGRKVVEEKVDRPLTQRLQRRLLASVLPNSTIFTPAMKLGQQIRGRVEQLLTALGLEMRLPADSHLCCSSAGTYSVLQSKLSYTLRNQKLDRLEKTSRR